ncbi:MAG: hypothetical protein IKO32_01455 [Lachnospiraceae bacterium]|nr:hypothetical protein [Lachnospiraceae bacterium]
MKKTVRVISVALILMMVLSAVACGKKAEPVQTEEFTGGSAQSLLGTWKGTAGEISTLSFTKDGKYMDNAGDGLYINGTYSVNESANTITVNEEEYGMVFVYNYSVSDNSLTLQLDGGKARKFTR